MSTGARRVLSSSSLDYSARLPATLARGFLDRAVSHWDSLAPKGRHIRCRRATTGLHENVSSKDLFFHSQQRRLLATVRIEPSMTGGAQFGFL